jgi:hypothetical protein
MGVESSATLTRWITDPSSRDFELNDLIVVTAQTGHEFPDTKHCVETPAIAGARYPVGADCAAHTSSKARETPLRTDSSTKRIDERTTLATRS